MLVGDPSATAQTPGIIGGATEETFLPADLGWHPFRRQWRPEPFRGVAPGQSSYLQGMGIPCGLITPANSTFTLEASVPAAAFTQLCPHYPRLRASTWLNLQPGRPRRSVNVHGTNIADHRGRSRVAADNYTVSANSVRGFVGSSCDAQFQGTGHFFQQSTYQALTRPGAGWAASLRITRGTSRWASVPQQHDQPATSLCRPPGERSLNVCRVKTSLTARQPDWHLQPLGRLPRHDRRSGGRLPPSITRTQSYATTSSFNWRTRIGYFMVYRVHPAAKGTGALHRDPL